MPRCGCNVPTELSESMIILYKTKLSEPPGCNLYNRPIYINTCVVTATGNWSSKIRKYRLACLLICASIGNNRHYARTSSLSLCQSQHR